MKLKLKLYNLYRKKGFSRKVSFKTAMLRRDTPQVVKNFVKHITVKK